MKAFLEHAAEAAGRHPHLGVAGHVRDYQRLTTVMADGRQIARRATGAGGYRALHPSVKVNGPRVVSPARFGFLRFEVTESSFTGRYFTVPRPQESFSKGNQLVDLFEYDWKAKRYIPNALSAS